MSIPVDPKAGRQPPPPRGNRWLVGGGRRRSAGAAGVVHRSACQKWQTSIASGEPLCRSTCRCHRQTTPCSRPSLVRLRVSRRTGESSASPEQQQKICCHDLECVALPWPWAGRVPPPANQSAPMAAIGRTILAISGFCAGPLLPWLPAATLSSRVNNKKKSRDDTVTKRTRDWWSCRQNGHKANGAGTKSLGSQAPMESGPATSSADSGGDGHKSLAADTPDARRAESPLSACHAAQHQ